MGVVSDEELKAELDNSAKPIGTRPTTIIRPSVTIIESPAKGRGEGNLAVPEPLQKLIGEAGVIDGRTESVELARQFGVSPSSASAYSNGAASTASYDEPKTVITDHLKRAKERIGRKARRLLIKSIDNITDEKLQDAKPEILASVAKNMSSIMKDMEPDKDTPDGKTGPTFVFYAPTFRDEKSFETVIAKDNY